RRLPLAAGQTLPDLLEQPAVSVRILERGKREVRAAFRVAPGNARLLAGVVERSAGEMEGLAHVGAAGDQVGPGGIEVLDRQDQALHGPGPGRRDAVAEDDRGV